MRLDRVDQDLAVELQPAGYRMDEGLAVVRRRPTWCRAATGTRMALPAARVLLVATSAALMVLNDVMGKA